MRSIAEVGNDELSIFQGQLTDGAVFLIKVIDIIPGYIVSVQFCSLFR